MRTTIINSRAVNRYTAGSKPVAISRLWQEVFEVYGDKLRPVIEKDIQAGVKRVSVVNLTGPGTLNNGTATVIVDPAVVDDITCTKILLPLAIGNLRLMTDLVVIGDVPASIGVLAESQNMPISKLVEMPAPINLRIIDWHYNHEFKTLRAPYCEEYMRPRVRASL